MKFQSHLKNAVASALVMGMLVAPFQTMAKADPQKTAAWTNIMGSAVSGLMGYLCTDFFVMAGVNIDAPQLALEYMVYRAMQEVTYKWKPKPQQYYQMAAKSNEDNAGVDTSSVQDLPGDEGARTFEAQALESVGIEVLGMNDVSSLANGRQDVVKNLTRLTYDGDQLVLNNNLTQRENEAISKMQAENYQKMATAGVARAELALETAYQASLDAQGDSADLELTQDTSGDDNIKMAAAGADRPNPTLSALPGEITSTGMGMRVQSLMNLELAQRINLANTIQGNILSIEAARALKNAPRPNQGSVRDNQGDDNEQ